MPFPWFLRYEENGNFETSRRLLVNRWVYNRTRFDYFYCHHVLVSANTSFQSAKALVILHKKVRNFKKFLCQFSMPYRWCTMCVHHITVTSWTMTEKWLDVLPQQRGKMYLLTPNNFMWTMSFVFWNPLQPLKVNHYLEMFKNAENVEILPLVKSHYLIQIMNGNLAIFGILFPNSEKYFQIYCFGNNRNQHLLTWNQSHKKLLFLKFSEYDSSSLIDQAVIEKLKFESW